MSADLEDFISAGILDWLSPTNTMLGGTVLNVSTVSRHVGCSPSNPDAMFDSDLVDFVSACSEALLADRAVVNPKRSS